MAPRGRFSLPSPASLFALDVEDSDGDDAAVLAWPERHRASAPTIVGRAALAEDDALVAVLPGEVAQAEASSERRRAWGSAPMIVGRAVLAEDDGFVAVLPEEVPAVDDQVSSSPSAASAAESAETMVRQSLQDLSGALPQVPVWSIGQVMNTLCTMAVMLSLVAVFSLILAACIALLCICPWLRVDFYVGVIPPTYALLVFAFALCFNACWRDPTKIASLQMAFCDIRWPFLLAVSLNLLVYLVVAIALEEHAMRKFFVVPLFCTFYNYSGIAACSAWKTYEAHTSEDYKARWAAKCESASRHGFPAPKLMPWWRNLLRRLAPWTILFGVFVTFMFGIGPLHGAVDNVTYRAFIYGFAVVVVKSRGKKLLAQSLKDAATSRPASVDCFLFSYDLTISLQSRLMLLREPDPVALLATGILTGLWELSLRISQVVLLRRATERIRRQLRDAEERAVAGDTPVDEIEHELVSCRQTVGDHMKKQALMTISVGADCLVEYLGANIAMALVAFFAWAGNALNFGATDLSFERVVLALLAQHGPELITDLVAMFFEVRAELDLLAYFRQHAHPIVIGSRVVCIMWAIFLTLLVRTMSVGDGS